MIDRLDTHPVILILSTGWTILALQVDMDLVQAFDNVETIRCIEMHTTGEPTRIIYSGFPALHGTLLEQRDQAKQQYDHVRKRLILEPRGHHDMYGAIIRPETELVRSGDAHVGVLFAHNGGFSTMCGHATIALGRFLVDTHDTNVFPKRAELAVQSNSLTVKLNLHAPCGLIRVTVPVTPDGQRSDPSRPVTFLSTPAFATALQIQIPIPDDVQWPELGGRQSICLDVSYGGAYYAMVTAQELGFANGFTGIDLDAVTRCVRRLKRYLETYPGIQTASRNPDSRLSFLYSVMIVDHNLGTRPAGASVDGVETGLCYFADNEIDRSPTGSCVSARMALAFAKGQRSIGQRWAYHSLVSHFFDTGAFTAEIVDVVDLPGDGAVNNQGVIVQVEGKAYYTGTSAFIVEDGDVTSSSGFTMRGVVPT